MKVAMIGAGRMGGTILRMLKGAGSWSLEACEPDSKGREILSKEMGKGVKFVEKVEELGEAEVVLLAVKPAMLEKVVGWLRGRRDSYLLISILAGVTTEKLAKEAGGKARVVRAMPNQALREIGEEQMDVVTALSGSGPAFMAKWVEELEKAAVRAGLDSKVSGELAARTMLGTGALLVREGIKPSELCAAVASPGGTTEAGLKVMQAGGIEALAGKAMNAAVNRAKELARGG